MRKLLLLFFILFGWLNGFTTNYFVNAITGADTNNGTSTSTPWKTTTKVNSFAFINGDIVSFNRGNTWVGNLVVTHSGVTYNAYGTGANPLITGFNTVAAWTSLPNNVWESSVAISTLTSCNIVSINGINTAVGRFPQSTYMVISAATGFTSVSSNSLNSSLTNWTGAHVVIKNIRSVISRGNITAASGAALTYTKLSATTTPVTVGAGMFIQNDVRTLTYQNAWYYNPTTKKIRIFSTSMPTNVNVAAIDAVVSISANITNITFNGIDFSGGNTYGIVALNNNTNLSVQNCNISFCGQDGVNTNISDFFTFNNSTVSNANNMGIYEQGFESPVNTFRGKNPTITHSKFHNICIFPGMIGLITRNGFGMRIEGNTPIIQYNVLDTVGYAPIYFDGNNSVCSNNFINYSNFIVDDAGGIYMFNRGAGTSPSHNYINRQIYSNIILNTVGSNVGNSNTLFVADGIYLDDLVMNVNCHDNFSYGSGEYGFFYHNTNHTNNHNNTFFNNFTAGVGFQQDIDSSINNDTIRSNYVIASPATQQCFLYRNQINKPIPFPIEKFGLSDSNYWARPINDQLTTNLVFVLHPQPGITNQSLAQWQAFSGLDAHSHKSPAFITNVNQLFYAFDSSQTPIVVSLPFNGVEVNGTAHAAGNFTLQPFTSIVLISTGGLITPTISWTPTTPITFGTALGAAQLNATSGGVPGTFVYTPAAGTILNAGTQTLSVVFTPTDQSTFATASKSVTIQVNPAPATISYSNLSQAYTGFGLQPTITTSPAGLATSTTYNGVGALPVNAGTYNALTGITNTNYTATPQSATFVITPAPATITVSNTAQIYDGTSKSVTVVTSPAGLSNTVTYNGSPTLPVNAGSYTVVVTLTDGNHTATPVTTTLVIAKATPTITWTPTTPITFPTALGGSQLNASASVAGTFIYTPASGTILNAGTQTLSADFTPSDATNYNSVNGTTRSITVNKGTATINISNLAQTYDGTQKTITVVTSPAGLGVLTITYNGSTTAPTAAGSYPINVTLNNSNYNATPATGTLVISKADATVSLNNLTQIYNGSQRVVTATTVPAGLAVNITYNGSGIAPTNAGSYPIVATINDPNLQGSTIGTLVVNKATPVITWGNPVSIVFGTPLTGTQLNASSSVAGTFVYTPPLGTILNAGTSNLIADFTPTDAANYNSVNGTTVSITVTKATATITVSDLNQFADGNPKPVTVDVSPNVGVIAVLYNGSPSAPSAIGSYPVSVTLTNSNYTAVPFSGTLVISASSASVTITNTDQIYDGSPKPVTVTTIPAGLPVIITYDDAATVPANSGTYSVTATINDGGIHTGSASATLTINKANPVVSWSNPTFISYGTALSGTQLNASANVAGTFTYTPAAGTILNAGTQPLSVNFTPTDAANYNSINGVTVNITVIKATATISLSNLNQIFDGSQKVVTVTTSPVGLAAISVTYNGSNTPPSAVGSYAIVASLNNSNYIATPANGTLVISTTTAGIFISNLAQIYTGFPLPVTVTTNPIGLSNNVTYNGSATVPTVSGTYTVIATLNDGIHTGADTETYVISKAQSIITWPNPAAINFGTALSSTQLNATANTPGAFTYSPLAGSILNAGTQSLSVTFTPTDNNFLPATKTVTIVVNQATATLTLSNLIQTYNATPRPVIVTTSPLGLSGVTILYNGSPTAPTNAGTYPVTVTLVNSNYTATPLSGVLTINKATPTLAWAQPAPVEEQTKLSALQLNATSTASGTFVYSPVSGTTLFAGTYVLLATFTPTDTVNFNSGTITVSLNVYGSPVKSIFIRKGNTKYMDAPIQ